LATARRLRRYAVAPPASSLVVLGSTALLSLALAWRELNARSSFTGGCASVQVFVLGFVVVLASIAAGRPDFSFLVIAYGIFFLFRATFSLWCRLARGP